MVIIASVETAVRSVVQRCNRPSPAQPSGARCLLAFSRSTIRPTLGTLENLHYTTYVYSGFSVKNNYPVFDPPPQHLLGIAR